MKLNRGRRVEQLFHKGGTAFGPYRTRSCGLKNSPTELMFDGDRLSTWISCGRNALENVLGFVSVPGLCPLVPVATSSRLQCRTKYLLSSTIDKQTAAKPLISRHFVLPRILLRPPSLLLTLIDTPTFFLLVHTADPPPPPAPPFQKAS